MEEEELALLEEQLATAHADVERLNGLVADAEARAAEAAELRQRLEAATSEVTEANARLQSMTSEAETLRASAAEARSLADDAVRRYRAVALAAEPDLPEDLVSGETVAAIDESLARARETVARVRQHIEQQARSLQVPAGAPARGGPDVAGLSAAEKIRLGLEQS